MPRVAGMPMGQGMPKKTETHVIHSDGTYSNPSNVVSDSKPTQPKRNFRSELRHTALLIFDVDGKEEREIVRDWSSQGLYTKPASMRQNPELGHCKFWRWDEFERHIREIIHQ